MKEFKQFDYRLIKLAIISPDCTIHFFNEYAAQTGRPDSEKDALWQLFHEKTCNVFADSVIAAALNGHVCEKADGDRCHGRTEFGACNEGGDRIIDLADTHDLIYEYMVHQTIVSSSYIL